MNTIVAVIKQLRTETGAGVSACRMALEQHSQDYTRALSYLRQQAARKAAQRSDHAAPEGAIELYAHPGGRIGVMVEINTETDFARRSEVFRRLAHEIALQITAACPLYVREEDIPPAILEEQVREASEKARAAGKPERVVEQIAAGVLEKYKDRHVLLRQAYIRDESLSVAQLLSQAAGQVGENIVIRRFVRWEIGPGDQAPGEAAPG